jgi:hypothetical protein
MSGQQARMTSLKAHAPAALLSCLAVTPVFAQAAIQEPGYFASFYPNLDVLKGGAPTPAARLASDPAALQAYAARESGIGLPRILHPAPFFRREPGHRPRG